MPHATARPRAAPKRTATWRKRLKPAPKARPRPIGDGLSFSAPLADARLSRFYALWSAFDHHRWGQRRLSVEPAQYGSADRAGGRSAPRH